MPRVEATALSAGRHVAMGERVRERERGRGRGRVGGGRGGDQERRRRRGELQEHGEDVTFFCLEGYKMRI